MRTVLTILLIAVIGGISRSKPFLSGRGGGCRSAAASA